MSNKFSIDDKVRQGIAQGEEPHNLGAWANMERMLDGKNPYQKEEEKKRKPWLFLLLGLIVCSSAVVGGYSYFSKSPSEKLAAVADSPSNFQRSGTTVINVGEGLPRDNKQPVSDDETIFTNANNSLSNAYASNSNESLVAQIRKKEIKQDLARIANLEANNINQATPIKASNKKRINNKLAQNFESKTSEEFTDKSKEDKVTVSIDNSKTTIKNTVAKTKTPIENNKNEVLPTIKENYLDTTRVTEISQRIEKDGLGRKKIVSDSFQYSIVKEKQRTVINPRFVALTQEQEEAAQRRTAIASVANNEATMVPQEIIEASVTPVASLSTNTEEIDNTAEAKKAQSSFFSLFKKAGASIRQKGIKMAHTRMPIYTGMFLGLNAALVNSKHNFGGFQGGLTAMTPLGRLVTLQAEARIMNQNNSGYTVTDSKNIIKSYFVDSTTLAPHGKIYNYEVDSVNYGYNLKDFYSLQVPVLVNVHLNKFNLYGGVHFNYGFRMNINTNSSSSPISIADTVFGSAYNLRTDSEPMFSRDDFADRMGLGYTIGGGYNFTNRINLDLRMSNLFWDNTKAAKQEISNVFFKIPSFQLSLGYKFRAFDIDK